MDEQKNLINDLLIEFSTRLNEIEEKQRIIKDRVLLIGENLVSTKEEFDKETLEFKKQLNQINFEIKNIKQINRRIVEELENFARKTELEILERQFNIFQPLELARVKDIKSIIKKEMLSIKNEKQEKTKL